MANSKDSEKCFIIMPITTPEHLKDRYKGDANHFSHVIDHLFLPALKNAGFKPVSPKSTGSDVIQAEIIKQLSSCELVLCDMSILNPNVFFEFGIRTALNKPVALVVDDKTKTIPFDTSIINFHRYDSSLDVWSIEKEVSALAEHVRNAYKKTEDHNALWKYFGVAQTGVFKPEDASLGEKIDLLMQEVATLKTESRESISPYATGYPPAYGESFWPYTMHYLPHHSGVYAHSAQYPEVLREETQRQIEQLEQTVALLRANMPKPQELDSDDKK